MPGNLLGGLSAKPDPKVQIEPEPNLRALSPDEATAHPDADAEYPSPCMANPPTPSLVEEAQTRLRVERLELYRKSQQSWSS